MIRRLLDLVHLDLLAFNDPGAGLVSHADSCFEDLPSVEMEHPVSAGFVLDDRLGDGNGHVALFRGEALQANRYGVGGLLAVCGDRGHRQIVEAKGRAYRAVGNLVAAPRLARAFSSGDCGAAGTSGIEAVRSAGLWLEIVGGLPAVDRLAGRQAYPRLENRCRLSTLEPGQVARHRAQSPWHLHELRV